MAGAAAKKFVRWPKPCARSASRRGRRKAPPNARPGSPTSPMKACSVRRARQHSPAARTGASKPTASSPRSSGLRTEQPKPMEFQKTPGWLDWYAGPSKPRFKLPAGAVDAHCHVFGPGAEFPYALERKYTPCDASKQQLYALRDHLRFARNVVVQATCHGADNRAMVDALVHSGGKARGVATVKRSISDTELGAMHEDGLT